MDEKAKTTKTYEVTADNLAGSIKCSGNSPEHAIERVESYIGKSLLNPKATITQDFINKQ
jgi:hypothetical protein